MTLGTHDCKMWTSDAQLLRNSLLAGLVRLALVCFVLPVMLLLLRHLLAAFGLLVCLGVRTFPLDFLAESDFFFFGCWLRHGLAWKLSWEPWGTGSFSDEEGVPVLGKPTQILRWFFSCWLMVNTSFRHFPQL